MGSTIISDDLLVKVDRGLIVVFLVTTLFTNAMFLYRCRRVSAILTKPISCSRILLSVGCILLAVFPYVIIARVLFNNTDGITKLSGRASTIYLSLLFPFVFGCSLTLQNVCLTFEMKSPEVLNACNLGPRIKTVLFAIFPWILGFFLAWAITILDNEYGWDGECFGYAWTKTIFTTVKVSCTIIPVAIAFLTSLILFRKARRERYMNNTSTSLERLVPSVPSAPPASPRLPLANQGQQIIPAAQGPFPLYSYTEKYPQEYAEPYARQAPPHYSPPDLPPKYAEIYPQQTSQYQQSLEAPYQQASQVHSQQYLQMYSSEQYPHYTTPSPNPQDQTTREINNAPPTTSSVADIPDGIEVMWKSSKRLLLCCLIFAFSVLPFSIFRLSLSCDRLEDMEDDMMLILHETVLWLLFMYPIVSPLIWIRDITA